MKYFHKLKAYQIIICETVLNEVHFKFQVTTNKRLKDSLDKTEVPLTILRENMKNMY